MTFYEKFLPYLHSIFRVCRGIIIQRRRIGNLYVSLIQMAHICGVNACGYPPLPEIEVKFLERDPAGNSILQRRKALVNTAIVAVVVFYPLFNHLRFLHHVSGDETVGGLVFRHKGIEVYMTLQFFGEAVLIHIHKRGHISEPHIAVLVERCRQRLHRGIHRSHLVDVEGDGMVEDVGLDKKSPLGTLQSKGIHTVGVKHNQLGVGFLVEMPVSLHELIVILVEVFAQFLRRLLCLHLVVI